MSALPVYLAPNPTLITRTSEYTTPDHIKQVILALQVWCHAELTDGLFNSADRAELQTFDRRRPEAGARRILDGG
jgi:hypothetical protein